MSDEWHGRSTLTWGGETRVFRLGFGELVAIEAETGLGYLEVWQVLASARASLQVVTAVIRYGLEGAGVEPQEAVRLTERYLKAPPFGDHMPVAATIYASALWTPESPDSAGKPEGDGTTGPNGSPSP